MLGAGGDCTNAIIQRCGIAWGKFRKLLRSLPLDILPSISVAEFSAPVCAVCTTIGHGSETWGPKPGDLQRLRRNDRSMIRWICGVRPQDHINSNDLLTKLGLADIGKL